MELWLDGGKLVARERWEKCIARLSSEQGTGYPSHASSLDAVQGSLLCAVQKRISREKFGIFLSGGVDSSLLALLAQRLQGHFTCYTVGFFEEGMKEPDDVVFARRVAKEFGFPLQLKVFGMAAVERLVQRAVHVLRPVGLAVPVHSGVASVIIAASELAQKDDITVFLGGLGSEEIFGGYHRHTKAADVQVECWAGLQKMWITDLQRDAALGHALGIEVRTPFLDQELIATAMRVPGAYKVRGNERKVILREAAEELGLLHDVAWRKKQAAQYGSSFDKMLEKLARKRGFSGKGEYLESLSSSN